MLAVVSHMPFLTTFLHCDNVLVSVHSTGSEHASQAASHFFWFFTLLQNFFAMLAVFVFLEHLAETGREGECVSLLRA